MQKCRQIILFYDSINILSSSRDPLTATGSNGSRQPGTTKLLAKHQLFKSDECVAMRQVCENCIRFTY